MPVPPSAEALAAILGPTTKWVRWLDIYESDNETPWLLKVPLTDGAVSVDETRGDRRTFDTTIHRHQTIPHASSQEDEIFNSPPSLWYDKILKPHRGVVLPDNSTETWQLGEFLIDDLNEPRFPKVIEIKCRDLSKMGYTSKFELATSFAEGQDLGEVIKDIASNAGFAKKIIPNTGVQLGAEFAFEAGTERWKAMEDLATAYGYEILVDGDGYFVLREIIDPTTGPVTVRFETGGTIGNLSDYGRRANDSRLYNHIIVTGKAADESLVWASALNLEPSSPTRIKLPGDELPGGLSDRLFRYHSDFINTFAQAQTVADNFLALHSLQAWELNLLAFVFPWLEAGEILEFVHPDPHPGEDEITRWRISNFKIPLDLSSMDVLGKMIQLVG